MATILAGFIAFVVVLYFSLQFIRGMARNKKLLVELQIDSAGVAKAGYLSIGFVVATYISAVTHPAVRFLLTPIPLVILLCIPGFVALRNLGLQLERSGTDRVKPTIEWVDKGKLVGFGAVAVCIICWVFSTIPLLIDTVTTG